MGTLRVITLIVELARQPFPPPRGKDALRPLKQAAETPKGNRGPRTETGLPKTTSDSSGTAVKPDRTEPKKRRLILETGSLVIVHPRDSDRGLPLVFEVDQVADGLHWFLGKIDGIERGQPLLVESPVANDARYVNQATVAAASEQTFALQFEPNWERVQQRAFVRVSARGVRLRIVRVSAVPATPEGADSPADEWVLTDSSHDLLDISAGGLRFETDDDYEPEEEVICHFELPGSLCYVLPGRIVRPYTTDTLVAAKPGVAVEFVGLDEINRSLLLRWIYGEQARRHREHLNP